MLNSQWRKRYTCFLNYSYWHNFVIVGKVWGGREEGKGLSIFEGNDNGSIYCATSYLVSFLPVWLFYAKLVTLNSILCWSEGIFVHHIYPNVFLSCLLQLLALRRVEAENDTRATRGGGDSSNSTATVPYLVVDTVEKLAQTDISGVWMASEVARRYNLIHTSILCKLLHWHPSQLTRGMRKDDRKGPSETLGRKRDGKTVS